MFRFTRLRVAVLLAGILAVGSAVLVARDDDAPREDELSDVGLPELEEVADRVERIRELEFEEVPEIEVLRDEDDVEDAITRDLQRRRRATLD